MIRAKVYNYLSLFCLKINLSMRTNLLKVTQIKVCIFNVAYKTAVKAGSFSVQHHHNDRVLGVCSKCPDFSLTGNFYEWL